MCSKYTAFENQKFTFKNFYKTDAIKHNDIMGHHVNILYKYF